MKPTFDLPARLRSRRLRWAGYILRSEESNLLRRVLLAQTEQEIRSGTRVTGGLLQDVQHFNSVEELIVMAEDRESWSRAVKGLLPVKEKKNCRNQFGAYGEGSLDYWEDIHKNYNSRGNNKFGWYRL